MTLSKQLHMKAITNNKTFCMSTYGKLLSHFERLAGKTMASSSLCLQKQHLYQYQSNKNYSHKVLSVIIPYAPVTLHSCDNNLQYQIIL